MWARLGSLALIICTLVHPLKAQVAILRAASPGMGAPGLAALSLTPGALVRRDAAMSTGKRRAVYIFNWRCRRRGACRWGHGNTGGALR